MPQYGVVFTGRLCEGTGLEEARANLARLLRIEDPARLDRLFSGKPVVIKKGLEAEQARRYETALLQAGVLCELRLQEPTSPPTAASTPERAVAPSRPVGSGSTPAGGAPLAPDRPALSLEPLAPALEASPAPSPRASGLRLEPLALAPAAEAPIAPPAPPPRRLPVAAAASAATEESTVRGIVIKGNGSGYGGSSTTPDEVKGLCWGGFFLPWIWGGFNGVSISFLALPGLGILRRVLPRSVLFGVSLLLSLFMLVKGRELAWQNKSWESVEHFNRVQRRWTQAGLAFALAMMVVVPSCVAREQREARELAAEMARLEAEMKAEEAAAAADGDLYGNDADAGGSEGAGPYAGDEAPPAQ